LIWKLADNSVNAYDFFNALPEKTELALSFTLKLTPIWDVFAKEAGPFADMVKANSGVDLPAFIADLGPHYGMILTLDESKPVTIPTGNGEVTIPEPMMLMAIQVQGDVVIKWLEGMLANLPGQRSTEDELNYFTFEGPMPIEALRPTIAWQKGRIYLASNDALIREMLAVKAGQKPGLVANSAIYKKLVSGLPKQATSVGYGSAFYQKTVRDLQFNVKGAQAKPAQTALMQYIYQFIPANNQLSIGVSTDEGSITITRELEP